MKNLFIILAFAIFGCTSSTESEVVIAQCPTEVLGLTIANKNPYLVETNLNWGSYDADLRCFFGKKSGDTLKLRINRRYGPDSGIVTYYNILLTPNLCPIAINTKQVYFAFDDVLGDIPSTIFDTTFDEFKVQQYVAGRLLVCKTKSHYTRSDGMIFYDNRDMWIDLANLTDN